MDFPEPAGRHRPLGVDTSLSPVVNLKAMAGSVHGDGN
jgi:hypothetical protein